MSNVRAILLTLAMVVTTSSAHADPARDGVFDPTFGTAGAIRLDSFNTVDREFGSLRRIVEQPDGKLLLLGSGRITANDLRTPAVLRLLADGTIDATFGVDGLFVLASSTPALGGQDGNAHGGAVLSDGRIVIVGSRHANFFQYERCTLIFAISSSGVIDPTYGPGPGPVCTDFGFAIPPGSDLSYASAGDVAALPDDKVLVVGPASDTIGGRSLIARFGSFGEVDVSYGVDGVARYGSDFFAGATISPGLIAASDGSAYTFGVGVGGVGAARLDSTGNLIAGFGNAGTASVPFGAAASFTHAAKVDAAGRIWVAGAGHASALPVVFECNYCVARFLPSGALDTSFNPLAVQPGSPGVVSLLVNTFVPCCVFAIATRPSGSAWLLGGALSLDDDNEMLILGLSEDGSFDSVFGDEETPGELRPDFSAIGAIGRYGQVLVETRDERVVIGGMCADIAAPTINILCLARLMNDAQHDDSFE
jgi:uncharacterized delta-60 repeat protein